MNLSIYQRLLRLPKVTTSTKGYYVYQRLLRLPKAVGITTSTKSYYVYEVHGPLKKKLIIVIPITFIN